MVDYFIFVFISLDKRQKLLVAIQMLKRKKMFLYYTFCIFQSRLGSLASFPVTGGKLQSMEKRVESASIKRASEKSALAQ